ncbi:hypothetical protein JTE90_017824 [Oedothorax gibbosus]|uniref:Protein FAM207A n=1 Tax=Oedothorax gibbosus TaxID=931172 RepID=A0AAV6V9B5_9ARAC|nr:hypothetical protein JTE90_017824 [Oedothorax gibbosus]
MKFKYKMGKIRNKRHTFHTTAPKLEEDEIVKEPLDLSTRDTSVHPSTSNSDPPFRNNIFGNVFIAPDMLKQQLITSVPTKKQRIREREARKKKKYGSLQLEFKEMLQANKKLKKKDRQPINSVFKVSAESLEKKNERKRKVGVNHMDSLMDALPSEKKVNTPIKIKPRRAKRFKQQAKEMSEDMDTFLGLMKNSAFVSDPFAAISSHIKKKLEAEVQST